MDNSSLDNVSVAATASSRSPSSTAGLSSTTTSPLIKGRPIRPLPRKPLRSRLSPEVAQSITYPPAPKVSRPWFNSPYEDQELPLPNELRNRDLTATQSRSYEAQRIFGAETDGARDPRSHGYSSEEENFDELRGRGRTSNFLSTSHTKALHNGTVQPPNPNGNKAQRLSAAPSIDSADGYDPFENTNNKKKRKIPTGTSLSSEMAHMGISSPGDLTNAAYAEDAASQKSGPGPSTQSNMGTGMGRSGVNRASLNRIPTRNLGGRSPLGVSTNGSNAMQYIRAPLPQRDDGFISKGLDQQSLQNRGIISSTMAHAASITPPLVDGQENMSVLEQHAAKTPSSKTQFTFTCDSDSGNSMARSGQRLAMSGVYPNTPDYAPGQPDFATQATQTSPHIRGQPVQTPNTNGAGPRTVQTPLPQQSAPPQQPERKPRRSLAKQLALQARNRRLNQEYNRFTHSSSKEDSWMCEFCEYEAIFGQPPQALIQQYEQKDRREKKRIAEKRRLLEKAKMKGRKGKKGGKAAAKNSTAAAAAAAQPQPSAQSYDEQLLDDPMHNPGPQSEEYMTADYDDDPLDMPGAMPASPSSRIPRPVRQNANNRMRPGGSNVPEHAMAV